jgi:hypothetical protein
VCPFVQVRTIGAKCALVPAKLRVISTLSPEALINVGSVADTSLIQQILTAAASGGGGALLTLLRDAARVGALSKRTEAIEARLAGVETKQAQPPPNDLAPAVSRLDARLALLERGRRVSPDVERRIESCRTKPCPCTARCG